MIRALVFDFDGLILDTEEPIYRSWLEVYEAHGEDLPFERWYREMRIRRVGEGPNEVQRHVIARDLLGGGLR